MSALDEARAAGRAPRGGPIVGRQPSDAQRALSGAHTGAGVITLPSLLGLTYRYDPSKGRKDGLRVTDAQGREVRADG